MEGLSQDLNYNVMFSQRGVYNLGHNLQDMRDIERRVSANRLNGIDAEVATTADIKKAIPLLIRRHPRVTRFSEHVAATCWRCSPRCGRLGFRTCSGQTGRRHY